jgi:UDP-N-acetylmuramate--alanine ligase
MAFKVDSLKRVYFIGIKGTGMCALAELFHKEGVLVSGSDREEKFYTDAILEEEGIPYYESFDPSHIEQDPPPDLVVYSAAYSFDTNPEMAEARRRGIEILKYPDALGAYSALFDSSGIAGVHGKTTTTAMAGAMIRGAGLPARVLAGSAVGAFGGRSTLSLGGKYFVAETCEYRRHFLAFRPRRIVLTSVEWDHQDYYPSRESIRDAFLDYCRLLPPGGELIYCADDPGACETAGMLKSEGRDLRFVPYGFGAEGDWRIESYEVKDERLVLRIQGFPGEFTLKVPGRHSCLNAAAALALTSSLVQKEFGASAAGKGGRIPAWNAERREGVRRALEEFSGSRRRTEILGEAGGILFVDDYGHHPTAIKTTLAGLKEFYPRRRLIVSFMSHTYTRTASLLDEFAASFDHADLLALHRIYASAREEYRGGVTGLSLFEKARDRLRDEGGRRVFYTEEPEDASETLIKTLRPGDLFITLGAGDNWKLGRKLLSFYKEKYEGCEGNNGKQNETGRSAL